MGVFASSRTPFTVELLIDNEIGIFALERQWHDSQTVEQREDGSVYVKFTTTQMPEVLGPAELVEQVRGELSMNYVLYN
jgi:hypothetical protein